jgi:MoaA/NifB/PqqE/SkfB family radical SAM enzyme
MARHVHLQGWGEPLLHPDLRAIVKDVHAAGCEVGITTNGDLLDEARSWIVAEPVDVLTVSLAGLGESNRRYRDGGEARELLEVLQI